MGIYFFKFSRPKPCSPAARVRHVPPPQDFWTRSRRGEGAGGARFPENDLALGLCWGPAPSTGGERRHPPPRAPRSARREREGSAPPPPALPAPLPLLSPAESPDVGISPCARSFISIKGQRLRGAEIAAAAGAPRPRVQLPPPRAAPPPAEPSRAPPARSAPGDAGEGAAGPLRALGGAEAEGAGAPSPAGLGPRGGERGWSAGREARDRDDGTPLVAPAGRLRFAG